MPASACKTKLSGVTWTCVASLGSSCPASGSGDISAAVSLLAGGTATFTVSATVKSSASLTLSYGATLAVPSFPTRRSSDLNSATDDTTITLSSDLAITKSDGKTSINAGTADS